MKNSFLIGLFFLVFATASAQKKVNTDSLEALLNPEVKDTIQVSLLNELSSEYARGNFNLSLEYSKKAYDLATQINYPRGQAKALRFMGKAYYFSNDHEKYVDYCHQSSAIAVENKLWDLAAENYEGVASANLGIWKNYARALEYYMKALEVYENNYPSGRIYNPLMGIGNVYKEQKQYDNALEYLNRALTLSEKANDNLAISICCENLGDIYFLLKQYDQSKIYFNRAFELFRKVQSDGGQIFCLMGLANVNRAQKNFEEALRCGQQSLLLSEKFEKYERPQIYSNESLGKTYLAMNNFKKAKDHFEKALPIALKLKMTENIRDLYGALAETCIQLNDPKQAYNHQKMFAAYADTLVQAEKIRQLAEMQARFETERKEKEIEILKRDKVLSQIYHSAAGGVVVVLLVIALLIFSRQTMKIKNERQLAEKENQILEERQVIMETQLRNKELTEKHLHDQIEFKNKELATHTLNLIQKNEILENIKQSVAEIKNLQGEEVNQKLGSLLNMVNYSLHLDKEWEIFKLHFEQVHQGFFKKLIDKHPDLNANDLKLSALIKLNLDNREVATILNISQDSAKVARHRLRKKLDLSTEQNLISFFNSLDVQEQLV